MTNLKQETVNTYNKSANKMSIYFQGIGPRERDIELAFNIAGNPSEARVVEIGCGDGRDARIITQRAKWYLGFDISSEFIKIAKKSVPESMFEVADATEFDFPPSLDIVFAFASLLHLNKEEVGIVFRKVYRALNTKGVFYISVKHSQQYKSVIKKDNFGKRLFYLYDEDTLVNLSKPYFNISHVERKKIGSTEWLELVLTK